MSTRTAPPAAGPGLPLLGHAGGMVRDPLTFLARLRDPAADDPPDGEPATKRIMPAATRLLRRGTELLGCRVAVRGR